MSAAFTCRILPVFRRIAVSAVESADCWRVMVSHLPHGSADHSATVRSDRIQGLPAALERVLDRLAELAQVDLDTQHHAVSQSFLAWAYGRPGMRPRSTAARERMHQLADRYLETAGAYTDAHAQTVSFAQSQTITLASRALPEWMQTMQADRAAGTALPVMRENLLVAISRALLGAKTPAVSSPTDST